MKKFKNTISRTILVETENIDTDQIIPARFLKTTERSGLGKYLFYNWRHDEKGCKKKSVFNGKKIKGLSILISAANFGTGSSREHAVWALMDYGFKAIISSEFGDIFYNNALKNGLLCIKLKTKEMNIISGIISKNPMYVIKVELKNQIVEIKENKLQFYFEIDSFKKSCLLLGVDELGYLLSHKDKISAYEKRI